VKFIADENIHRLLIASLRDLGHEVLSIAESYRGIADLEVLAIARSISGIIITEDKDFGELVFRDKHSEVGIVLLRLADVSISDQIDHLSRALDLGHDLSSHLTVIESTQTRIRRLK
jgi:predicted nuclease of predicted toxin-antitoxin system